MTSKPRTKRRVVIIDDSRTMQAILENAFSEREDFSVVGVAGDAQSGADMITLLKPEIATIDLCMPYIDGAALLEMIGFPCRTCVIVVSDKAAKNVMICAKLKERGASACLSKHELADDPGRFFNSMNATYSAFQHDCARTIAAGRPEPKAVVRRSTLGERACIEFGFPVPTDEDRRLDILGRSQLANAVHERKFDLVTKHLAVATGFPVCLLTFIDKHTQWIKSAEGIAVESTPREQAFCNYTISQDGTFVVANAAEDSRFAANPMVTGAPYIRSYAGHPVLASDGTRIGALCLIDVKARVISPGALRQLSSMADIVSEMIDCQLPKSARLART
ncbi:response regulator [Sphingomonas sp. PAMC 26621]|uniref:response regulator n=1 Tax=Sphingomonas sp. PAMC 26621 TaxID=1112213 RepID=UPI0006855EF9|nr:response regulator [Sphingomonas sp. PAMC 26621]